MQALMDGRFGLVVSAVLGLCVGSFLNVVIARVPEDLSIVSPGSRCPRCGHALAWYENIPLLSWIFLRARCSSCAQPISVRYPLIEALTASLFVLCTAAFGWGWPMLSAWLMVGFLIPLTFIDLDHWLLPNELTFPGIGVGILAAIPIGWTHARDAVIGAVVAYLVFWAMEWIGEKVFKKEALGGGDKNLLALIGAFLGYRPLLGVIFLASLQGSIIGISLLAARGRAGPAPTEEQLKEAEERRLRNEARGPDEELEDDWVPGASNMPFGPWLALAAVEMLILGPLLASRLPWPLSVLLGGAR